MINKKELLRKIKKNRFLVLVVSAIVISGIYFGVEKAIDSYVFKTNSDIVVQEEFDEEGEFSEKVAFDKENGGGQFSEDEVDLELEETADGSEEEVVSEGSDEAEKEKIFVYITGEVNTPGVVILDKGSRIVDAINAAGGTTSKANISKVNLVYVLEDGMKVNIPNNNDVKNNSDFEYITMNSGDGASDEASGGGSGSGSGGSSSTGYSIVNINTATQTELESLPGIGPSLALKIINYRKEKGKFSSIDEIKNVSGIGDSKFESLKKYITI